jgi:hypothetical protein
MTNKNYLGITAIQKKDERSEPLEPCSITLATIRTYDKPKGRTDHTITGGTGVVWGPTVVGPSPRGGYGMI